MFEDLTIGVCFYRTPNLLIPFLKSFAFHHKENFKILVSENSPDNLTIDLLREYNIPHISNPGMTHNPAVNLIFENVKTKYLLLCDSDILIKKPIYELLDLFRNNNLTSMGEIQYDRGGYQFAAPRVAPYFNLIDLEIVKKHNIKFYDPERVKLSQSDGFFANVPIQKNIVGHKFYDTGTSFYEDVTKNGLKIGKINMKISQYVRHYEGMSWRKFSGVGGYVDWGNQVEQEYLRDINFIENVSIKDRFVV